MNSRQANRTLIVLFIGIILCCMNQSHAQIFNSEDDARTWADKTLAGLTLEKKIGQMICTDIHGEFITEDNPELKRWDHLARNVGVGGFVVYGGTPRDVAHLLNRLQKSAEIPLLMSVDFEGGPGQQIVGASEFPANMAFAAAGSESLMYEAAKIGAIEGRAMGFHLTYTPVVDVSVAPDNPSESVRSFGGDFDLLKRMVSAYVRGYGENGMLTTAKHFPGRGDADLSDEFPGFRIIDKPARQVKEQEFRAFKHAIDAGVTFVMSEHIAVPSVTGGSNLPASVEGKLVTAWLRDKLGFEGILTTDDLWYDHVIERFGSVEVAVRAIEAGHDIILKPKDVAATIEGLAEAVRSGRIKESRIDHSVRKLLIVKARLNLHRNRLTDESRIPYEVGSLSHLEVVQEVADRSLTLLKNEGVLPVNHDHISKIVNISVQKQRIDPSPQVLALKLKAAFPGLQNRSLYPDMDPSIYQDIRSAVDASDLVILSLFVQRDRHGDPAPFRKKDLQFIRDIIETKPGAVIAMAYGNPFLILTITDVPAFIVGYGERGWYGNQSVYFDSFIQLLQGNLTPEGKLPIEVSQDYPIGIGLTF